jgi:hypothetical protein
MVKQEGSQVKSDLHSVKIIWLNDFAPLRLCGKKKNELATKLLRHKVVNVILLHHFVPLCLCGRKKIDAN